MLIKCIQTIFNDFTFEVRLIKDKYYTMLDGDDIGYLVVDEREGKPLWYSDTYFEPIEEARDRKLKELLQ
jgi:hypothetical protein